jgi:hypothetical protein
MWQSRPRLKSLAATPQSSEAVAKVNVVKRVNSVVFYGEVNAPA